MSDTAISPVPAWKRYATMALIAVLAIVAGYVLYTKEFHHKASSAGTTPPATAPAPPPQAQTRTTAPTTIPGGIAISSRNPFQ